MNAAATAESVRHKVARRLLPPLFVMFVLSFLDRTNVALVKSHLATDAGIDAAAFGLGAGIFFVGYAVLGVPSNLVLHRFGARRWLAFLMLVWGLLSCAMGLVDGPGSFYVLRFLLGAAEAGFFPGVILYITYWFPAEDRGKATGMFQSAVAVASIIGNPVGGYLLGLHGLAGLEGWKWMFILEGAPTVVMALAVPWLLTDRPEQARWLTAAERGLLTERIAADVPDESRRVPARVGRIVRDSKVLRLMFVYFAIQIGVYGVTFWLPALVGRIEGLDDLGIGFVSALPWVFALLGVIVLPWLSDRSGDRRGPLRLALLLTLAGLIGGVVLPPVPAVAALCVAAFGFLGAQPVFWTVPPTILSGAQMAGTIALISGFGNLGGFIGPYVMGAVEKSTGSGANGLYLIAAVVAVGALVVTGFRWTGTRRQPAPAGPRHDEQPPQGSHGTEGPQGPDAPRRAADATGEREQR
ncbi:MFS transporter [Streptomyces sp. HNM0575]|uniref:MFS transporter n=1 Tax=Streptomyces sp. HNM0575 TaxID=2716338 RepID=UPI00145DD1A4|nr:MFS transporter [Streptomyces sp. HNM0575]NLU72511.1 MFS transporter [Streptomyces sp. HNM0575]